MKIRYAALYSGRDRWVDSSTMEAFDSIESAGRSMQTRQKSSYGTAWITELRENADGLYVVWSTVARRDMGETSGEDTMDLYRVSESENGQYSIGDPECRLSFGPRGGIIKESY